MHSRPDSRLMAVALLLLPGCALTPGEPWGVAELSLRAGWPWAEDRVTGDGLFKTAQNYALEIEELSLVAGTLTVALSEGGEAAGFDPANPPEGCGLCHSGHCHCGDELVSYEELAAQAGGEGGGSSLSVGVLATPLGREPSATSLGECPDGCQLERGALTSLTLGVERLSLRARVFDTLEPPRLPEEGVVVVGELALDAQRLAALSGEVDRGEPLGVRIGAEFSLGATWLDGVDFEEVWVSQGGGEIDLSADAATLADLAERISTGSNLEVQVERF